MALRAGAFTPPRERREFASCGPLSVPAGWAYADPVAQDRIVHAACPHDCPDGCAMLVTVRDDVAVKVAGNPDHPITAGALCAKVNDYVERVYAPDRLRQPL